MESKLFVTISASVIGIIAALILGAIFGGTIVGIVAALIGGAGAYFFSWGVRAIQKKMAK